MKKIVSMALIAIMLVSLLTVTASAAKDPFGTVVEIKYTTTAPSMDDALPDASWGEKIVHVDKNSPNAGITEYSNPHDHTGVKVDQTINMDVYGCWTDDTLYLCFTSPDKYIAGGAEEHRGDGFQLDMVYGIVDFCHNSAEIASTPSTDAFKDEFSYGLSFDFDDSTPVLYGAAEFCEATLFWDERTQTKVGKYAVPFSQLGIGKKAQAKDGDIISFAMLCVGAEEGDGTGYTGWLEWGNFFDDTKIFEEPGNAAICTKESLNSKTKTGNSFKLVGKSSGATTPTTPETPTTPTTPAATTTSGQTQTSFFDKFITK